MLNAGFQYLEQRDANNAITKNGVVSKNSPFATSDNSGIYDVIAENFRAIKDMLDTVSSSNDLSSIRDEIKTMYDDMRTNEKFGSIEATEQAAIAKEQAAIATEKAKEAAASLTSITDSSKDISVNIKTINDSISAVKTYLDTIQSVQKDVADNAQVATNQKTAAKQAADKASTSETNAASSAASSAASASAAKDSETNAKTSETNAKVSASSAASSAESAQNAKDSAESIKDTVMSLKSGAEKAISDHNNAMAANNESIQEKLSLTNQAYNKANDSASTAEMWAEGDVPSENVTGDDGAVTVVAHKSSKGWATESKLSAESSAASADNASKSASEAHEYLDTVATNASKAESSATAAKQSEDNALSHADGAKVSASNAKASETNASTYANTSKAWAMKAKSSAQSASDNAKESKENANNVATALQNMQAVQSNILSIQEQIKKLEEEANKCLSDAQSIRDSISSSVVYKGSVDTYTALPTSNKVGDMYNIAHADSDHGIKAGDNVIWNGTDWDNTGGTIDTSTFAQIGSDVSFGTVTATTFKGKADAAKVADSAKICTGNSASASSVPWSGVTGKPGTYPPSAHNHDSAYPSVTGTRASGTWGINISGNAASATRATTADVAINDSSGANIASTYIKKTGDAATGKITFKSTDLNALPEVKKTSDDKMSGIRFSSKTKFLGAVGKRLSDGENLLNLRSDNTTTDVVLDSRNYNNYAPTKTGGGASGTWGINISGNAASATNADKVDGYHASDLLRTLGGNRTPVITDIFDRAGTIDMSTMSAADKATHKANINKACNASQNIWNTVTGITAYGGDYAMANGYKGGSLKLTQSWRNFDKLMILYTDDEGYRENVRTFDVYEFNYCMENMHSIDISLDRNTYWYVYGLTSHGTASGFKHSTETMLSCLEQNCGIVGIYGIKY